MNFGVVLLSPVMVASKQRGDYMRNIEHIARLIDLSVNIAAQAERELGVVVLPEMAIQGPLRGFRAGDHDRQESLSVDLAGPEVAALAEKARQHRMHIVAQLYLVRDDDFPGRYFNRAFIIDPAGEVIYQRTKLQVEPLERQTMGTTCPHDIWDEWLEKKAGGGSLAEVLYPVVDTAIGRLGVMVCLEGSYPEIGRGLALNGAEIIVRQTYREPYVSNGWWELQNRAHAMFNNVYVLGANMGPSRFWPDDPTEVDVAGGQSMIVDHLGQIQAQRGSAGGSSILTGAVDLDALRAYRRRVGVGSWLKDLRTEQFLPIYQRPVFPANSYAGEPPGVDWLEAEQKFVEKSSGQLIERGIL